jgi:hypothetical protein
MWSPCQCAHRVQNEAHCTCTQPSRAPEASTPGQSSHGQQVLTLPRCPANSATLDAVIVSNIATVLSPLAVISRVSDCNRTHGSDWHNTFVETYTCCWSALLIDTRWPERAANLNPAQVEDGVVMRKPLRIDVASGVCNIEVLRQWLVRVQAGNIAVLVCDCQHPVVADPLHGRHNTLACK